MTSTTMVAGPATTHARLRRLRGQLTRARLPGLLGGGTARRDDWEVVCLRRTLRRVRASLADPLLRNWCCCADPPVLTGLAGWRDAGRRRGGRLPAGARLPVNECPLCGRDDAGGWAWTRTEPRPSAPPGEPA
jgi:hypothetical protein